MSDQHLPSLARELQHYAENAAGAIPDAVVVSYHFEDPAIEPLTVALPRRQLLQLAAIGAEGAVAAIIEVVESLDVGERLTGREIAERAGYRYGGWFATLLADLVRQCIIHCERGSGYGRVSP